MIRKLALMIMLSSLSTAIYAQQGHVIALGNGTQFYKGLSARVGLNIDTLSNLSSMGTMYVRFSIGADGIKDVKCSPLAPEILKKVITDALLKTDKSTFNKNAVNAGYYFMPVEYDFYNSGAPKRLSALLEQVPKFEINEPRPYIKAELASVFPVPEGANGDLYGVKCILLDVFKIRGKVQ